MIESALSTLTSPSGPDGNLLPVTAATGNALQPVDLTGNNFLDLLLSRILPMTGLAKSAGPVLLHDDGENLPGGKDLPYPAVLERPDFNSDKQVPDVNPLVALIFKQVDAATDTGEVNTLKTAEPGTVDATRSTATQQTELTDVLKNSALHTDNKKDIESLVDSLKPRLLFDKGATGELVKSHDNNVIQLDRAVISTAQPVVIQAGRQTVHHAAGALQLSIDTPLDHPQWGQSLAARVSMMIAGHHQSAQISINPPDLGPIEVKVTVNHDQANVNFFAHHGEVRDAIADAFPRLRELLGHNGMSLGESNVFDHSLAQDQQNHTGNNNYTNGIYPEFSTGSEETSMQLLTAQVSNGLVDQYV